MRFDCDLHPKLSSSRFVDTNGPQEGCLDLGVRGRVSTALHHSCRGLHHLDEAGKNRYLIQGGRKWLAGDLD